MTLKYAIFYGLPSSITEESEHGHYQFYLLNIAQALYHFMGRMVGADFQWDWVLMELCGYFL